MSNKEMEKIIRDGGIGNDLRNDRFTIQLIHRSGLNSLDVEYPITEFVLPTVTVDSFEVPFTNAITHEADNVHRISEGSFTFDVMDNLSLTTFISSILLTHANIDDTNFQNIPLDIDDKLDNRVDIILNINDNNNNKLIQYRFNDCILKSLSGLVLTTKTPQTNVLNQTVTFICNSISYNNLFRG